MNHDALPPSWTVVRLDEIAEVNPRRPKLVRADDEPTTFVPMPAVDGRFGVIAEPLEKAFGAVKKGYTYFQEGDVIFAKITPCMENGKHAIARDLIDGIGFGSTEFHVLRPSEWVMAEWLWLYLRQRRVLAQLAGKFVGSVGQQRLPDNVLAAVELPVPPMNAQKRLGACVMEAIAQLEDGLDVVGRNKTRQVSYERAVVDEAVARLGTDMPTACLGDIADVRSGLTKGRTIRGSARDRPFLRAGNLGNGRLLLDEIRTTPATDEEAERFRLAFGDVLLVEGSGSADRLGQGWIWEGQIEACLHQNHVFRVRPLEPLEPRYLAWVLQSSAARAYFLAAAKTTSGLHTINRTQVVSFELPLPDRDQQRDLVKAVDARVDAGRRLADEWGKVGARLVQAREALLAQAFHRGL